MRGKAAERALTVLKTLITFGLVTIAWIFFRARDMACAWQIIRSFAVWNPWQLVDGTLYTLGLERADFWIMIAAIGVLLAVDILHVKGAALRDTLLRWPLPVRWCVVYGAMFAILLFGIYGPAYDASAFIYFQF